jgi:hypothetical protein
MQGPKVKLAKIRDAKTSNLLEFRFEVSCCFFGFRNSPGKRFLHTISLFSHILNILGHNTNDVIN